MPEECNPSNTGTRKGDVVDLGSNVSFWNGLRFCCQTHLVGVNLNRVPLERLITLKMLKNIWLLVKMVQIVSFVLKT